MSKHSVTLWDRLGIGLSTLCLIHCLALPVLVSLLPIVPVPEVIHEWSHPVLAVVILPTIVLAIRRSAHDRRIHAYLIGGFAVILTGWAVGHSVLGFLAETTFTVAGSVLLIIGHVLNYRHHQVCKNDHHHHHPHH